MAAAARSPSPSPGPGRPCCAMRRSADSNPFKPLASDSPQRSSSVCKNSGGGHASPRGPWWAEKENEQRDAARAATPKARSGCGGGGKGFMAPTISAASKASPRKKVLGERNEQPQQHHHVFSSPAELAHGPKGGPPEAAAAGTPRRLRLSFDGAPATPAASSDSRHSLGGGEARSENPVCNNHHHHHHAAAGVAGASADSEPPRAGPYDPKTNYLSPRPRFLHYKPNPRVELYRHGGGGVRRLEDGFASESSDDTDTTATTEEELAEEEKQEQAPPPPPVLNDLPEESSDLAVEPTLSSRQARVLTPERAASSPRARALIPEPDVTSLRSRALTPEPELAASSNPARAKKRSPLRFLLAPFALVLFMAAALVCVPPPPGSPVMSTTALLKVSEFLSVQESYPVELAAWLKQWSSSSLDLVTSYWEAIASAREQEYSGPHFAANSSAAAEEPDQGADFYFNFAETWSVPREEPVGDNVLEHELKIQDVVSASDAELIAEEVPINGAEVEEETVPERASIIEEANEYGEGMIVMEELDAEMSEEVPDSNAEEVAYSSQNMDIPSSPSGHPEQVDNFESRESSLQQNVERDESEDERADGKVNHKAYPGSSSELGMLPGYMEKVSQPVAVGVALAAVILSAALAFLYIRQKQAQVATNTGAPAEQAEQAVQALSGSGSSEGQQLVKGKGSQAEETERIGGSGASMYSSSLSSGQGRRLRRESTAHSTSSYGSFTTYEKIPAKKGNKEDEAMTPVRRSSRLRGQAKSPEA